MEKELTIEIARLVDVINHFYLKHGDQAKLELTGYRNNLIFLINDKQLSDLDKRIIAKLPSRYKIDLNNLIQTFRR